MINANRDMGATHVHGITGADVLDAPTFDKIAPKLLAALAGRTLVAHNARFDLSFLHAELSRAGYDCAASTPYLCTMEWASGPPSAQSTEADFTGVNTRSKPATARRPRRASLAAIRFRSAADGGRPFKEENSSTSAATRSAYGARLA